jgi:sugar-specific transcriptional regulator TrmB
MDDIDEVIREIKAELENLLRILKKEWEEDDKRRANERTTETFLP